MAPPKKTKMVRESSNVVLPQRKMVVLNSNSRVLLKKLGVLEVAVVEAEEGLEDSEVQLVAL